MMGWNISPDGVSNVLTGVETAAAELSAALDSVSAAHQDLLTGSGGLGDVPAAVQDLMVSEQDRLNSIGNRIAAGSLGASTATIGYVQGDEEMAANAQAAAGNAAASGDMSFYTPATGNP